MTDQTQTIELAKEQLLCHEGDSGTDLYFVLEGELMICTREGRMVTPLAYLTDGDYFGELSFFDEKPRSADVIALKQTKLIKIPRDNIIEQIPQWVLTLGQQMSKKIRLLDEAIGSKGIKRQNVTTIKPLSIEEQRYYYEIISQA